MTQPSRTERLLRGVAGLLLLAFGSTLILNSASAVTLIIWLLGGGLILAGALRMSDARDNSAYRVPILVSGGLLIISGAALPFWRSASLPMLALIVSLVLFGGGTLRFLAVYRGQRRPAFRGMLTALTGIFGSVLVLFWPKLSLWVLGVAFGGWLLLLGLRSLFRSMDGKLPEIPRWAKRTGLFGLTVASLVGLIAVLSLGGVTAFLHATSATAVADEFYLPPASVPDGSGQLLRSEPLQTGVLEGTLAWRILYTTTQDDGTPSVASGIVTVPKTATGTLPVISWVNGTKGVQSSCALSMASNPYDDGPAIARQQMLEQGWAIVATDYIGLGTAGPHPYLVPGAEAHAVLDATLAAQQLGALKNNEIQLGNQTVLWGHSQGGHAALASAEMASSYAPSLQILGVAAMAPATDLVKLAGSVAESPAGKIVSSYIASSWNDLYPQLHVEDRLSAGSKQAVTRLSQNCFSGMGALTGIAQATQLFEPIFSSGALEGELNSALQRNSAPIPLNVPIFISQGAADSLVLPSMQRDFVQQACAAGANLAYEEYAGLDHMPLVGDASELNQDLVAFSESLLDSTPQFPDGATGCGS